MANLKPMPAWMRAASWVVAGGIALAWHRWDARKESGSFDESQRAEWNKGKLDAGKGPLYGDDGKPLRQAGGSPPAEGQDFIHRKE